MLGKLQFSSTTKLIRYSQTSSMRQESNIIITDIKCSNRKLMRFGCVLMTQQNTICSFNYFCLFCGHRCNRLFEEIDVNRDNHISRSELEKVVKDIHFNKFVDAEEAVAKLAQDLDVNRDDEISETEFIEGFAKWMNSNSSQAAKSKSSSQGNHQVFYPSVTKKFTTFNFCSFF